MKSEATENGWRILIDDGTVAAVGRVTDAMRKNAGGPIDQASAAELKKMRPRLDNFMVGRLSLATIAEASGRNEEAGMHALAGFQMGAQSLPEFDIPLDISDGHTRCFLELGKRYVIALESARSWAEATRTIRRMTEWDRTDQLGMRARLGPVLLRKGDLFDAIIAFSEGGEVPHPTTLWYERALAAFMDASEKHRTTGTLEPRVLQDWYAKASRYLQRAMVENPYVADALQADGSVRERPRPSWFAPATSEGGTGAATNYSERYGSLWRIIPSAFRWLNWVETHPVWLKERAGIWALDYEAATAADDDERVTFECRGLVARDDLYNSTSAVFGRPDDWKAAAVGGRLPWEKDPPKGLETPGRTKAWWDLKIAA